MSTSTVAMRSCLGRNCRRRGQKLFRSQGPGNRLCPACRRQLRNAGGGLGEVHPVAGPGLDHLTLQIYVPAQEADQSL